VTKNTIRYEEPESGEPPIPGSPSSSPTISASHKRAGTQKTSGTARLVSPSAAAQVETCGVHFPRLMSDAYALEHLAASAISENFTPASLGRIHGGTAPGRA
jgi:hypothetical protein